MLQIFKMSAFKISQYQQGPHCWNKCRVCMFLTLTLAGTLSRSLLEMDPEWKLKNLYPHKVLKKRVSRSGRKGFTPARLDAWENKEQDIIQGGRGGIYTLVIPPNDTKITCVPLSYIYTCNDEVSSCKIQCLLHFFKQWRGNSATHEEHSSAVP